MEKQGETEGDYRVTPPPTTASMEPSSDRYIPVKKVWIPAYLRFAGDQVRFEIRRSHERALR
ncbi:hypothetical protein X777_04524 [Ooceraea biroi]|uniref:Uncharacterized protein n=1 Tax=Ooceraea biroi TaxID=2015173 RepID=A0A026WGF6_OOCBI|nr:hypothetical protein X777_04524 [Ooceraea biroi]